MNRSWKKLPLLMALLAGFILFAMIVMLSLIRPRTNDTLGLLEISEAIVNDRPWIIALHRLNDMPEVKAIVIAINCPGGYWGSIQSLGEEIKKMRLQGKPIFFSIRDFCFSGGYYLACSGTRLYANPASMLGIKDQTVDSFATLPNFAPQPLPAAVGRDIHTQMLDMLFDRRGNKLASALARERNISATDLTPEEVKKRLDELESSGFFTGHQAYEKGLIDEVGNLDDAVAAAAQIAGLKEKPRIIIARHPRGKEEKRQVKTMNRK